MVCLNRRVIATGSPAEVLTERVLTETYQRHLLAVGPLSYLRVDAGERVEG